MKVAMAIVLYGALLVFISNGLALAIHPTWAVRRSWCLLNEETMRRQFSMWNMDYNPSLWELRSTGMMMLFFLSFILNRLFVHADNSGVRWVWAGWVLLMLLLTTVQGFAWTFSPRWLVSRFPSLTQGFPRSLVGRVMMRLTGLFMLAAVFLYLVVITAG